MTADPSAHALAGDCWNRIGTSGDRTCPELETVVHCRNCPVHAAAARTFFDRQAPAGYLEEWTRLLAEPVAATLPDDLSVLIFRLGSEWLAVRTRVVVEVTLPRPVHRIPHRSDGTLIGMVNLRGQLHLLVSLHGLLGTDETAAAPRGGESTQRLIVMSHAGQTWVVSAEEVRGVKRLDRSELAPVPSNLANPSHSFSQAVVLWEGRSVGFLDDQRVFERLRGTGK